MKRVDKTMQRIKDIIFLICRAVCTFKRFLTPRRLTRISVLIYKVNARIKAFANESKSKKVRIDSAFEALDLVLKYKRENPQEFEEIFRALERFSQKRKSDSKIDEEIESLLWGKEA